ISAASVQNPRMGWKRRRDLQCFPDADCPATIRRIPVGNQVVLAHASIDCTKGRCREASQIARLAGRGGISRNYGYWKCNEGDVSEKLSPPSYGNGRRTFCQRWYDDKRHHHPDQRSVEHRDFEESK